MTRSPLQRLQDSFVSSKQGQGHRLLPQLEPSFLPCPFCEASSAQTYLRAASCPRAEPVCWASTTWNNLPSVLILSQTGGSSWQDCLPLDCPQGSEQRLPPTHPKTTQAQVPQWSCLCSLLMAISAYQGPFSCQRHRNPPGPGAAAITPPPAWCRCQLQ